jgi:hypothetical protein
LDREAAPLRLPREAHAPAATDRGGGGGGSGEQRQGEGGGYLAEIGRELEGVDATSVVAHDEDGILLVEANMSELGTLHNFLFTEWLVFILREIEHMDLPREEEEEEERGQREDPREVIGGEGVPFHHS